MVGGFTANGDAVMPILEAAGIPWFAPPGISAAELSSEDSYPITSGVLGLAGLGQMAAEDGCDKVASVNFDLPSAGSISQLVDLALTNAGHDPSTLIKVPPTTTDYSAIAQEASDYDCAVVGTGPQQFLGIAAAGAQLGSTTTYYVVPGGLTDAVARNGGESVEGAKSALELPDDGDPIWDEAKEYVGDLEDEENGGWSALYFSNTWVGYRTLLSLIKNNDRLQRGRDQGHARRDHAGRHRRLHAAVQLRRGLPGAGAEPGVQLLRADLRDQGRQAGPGRLGVQGHATGARPRVLT